MGPIVREAAARVAWQAARAAVAEAGQRLADARAALAAASAEADATRPRVWWVRHGGLPQPMAVQRRTASTIWCRVPGSHLDGDVRRFARRASGGWYEVGTHPGSSILHDVPEAP